MPKLSILFSHGIIPQQNKTRKKFGTIQPPGEHEFGYAFCSFCPKFWKLKKKIIIYTVYLPQRQHFH